MPRTRHILLVAAAAWALLLLPILERRAAADTGNAEIDRGIALYNDLEYEQAAAVLDQALQTEDLTSQQRAEGYKALALAYLALGRNDDARAAFRRLLETDPDATVPRTESQKAQDIFNEVKQSMPRQVVESPVRLSQTAAPPRPHGGTAVAVTVALVDPDGKVSGVEVRYRRRGQRRYSTVRADGLGEGRYDATISGAFVGPPALEYYVVAVDAEGGVVASEGSEADPVALIVDKPGHAGAPIYGRWWFWASIGGLAIASAAVGIALAGGESGGDATVNVTVDYQP